MFLDQFAAMQNDADYVILGGDIFDGLPSMDEVELYFDLVSSIIKPCVIYPGNHEMLKKTTTFLSFLKKSTHRLNPLVRIVDDYESMFAGDLDILPYNRLKTYNPDEAKFSGRILCTHVRGEIPPHVKPEVPLELFDRWQVVLAGDLHSYENSQRNILYPGSPYTTSFHRSEVSTGAIMLDTDDLSHTWLKFNLPQLIKKTLKAGETPVKTDFHHTIYEIEGNLQELGTLEDNDLVDKKIVKRSHDTQLILDPQLSMAEEVKEYLSYILQLPEDTISDVLQEFFAFSGKLEE